MRVLMTGFTTMQVGRPGKYEMATFANLLPEALRRAGHEVDQRPVDPGEPLDGYNAVLVGVIDPNSLAAGFRYGALDTVRRARLEAGALGFFLDDWQVHNIAQSIDYLRREPKRLVKPMLERKPGYEWATRHVDQLVGVLDALATRPWPVTLVPAFEWGDHTILVDRIRGLTADRAVFLDPSGLAVDNMATLACGDALQQVDREEVWLSPALVERNRWLDNRVTTWPVRRVGAKSEKATEPEVIDLYGSVTGTVALPYQHVGSGWWRNRFDFASERGALMLCDPRETADLHVGFAQSARFFEEVSPQSRQVWADFQRECLRARRWPVERLIREADAALRQVVEGGPAPGVPGA